MAVVKRAATGAGRRAAKPAGKTAAKSAARTRGVDATHSKSLQAYALLEERIVTMRLAPGRVISEAEVAASLGLGRTPVREALQRLAAEGLVEIMPRRGIRVSGIDIRRQLRLVEARRVVESLVVELAVKRVDAAGSRRFAAIAEGMNAVARSGDYAAFLHLDSEYNALLAQAADNEFAAAMLARMHGLARRFWHRRHTEEGELDEVARLHADVAAAIAARQRARAVAACRRHMDYIERITRAAIDA